LSRSSFLYREKASILVKQPILSDWEVAILAAAGAIPRFSWNPEIHPVVETKSIIDRVVESGTDSVVVTGGNLLCGTLTTVQGPEK